MTRARLYSHHEKLGCLACSSVKWLTVACKFYSFHLWVSTSAQCHSCSWLWAHFEVNKTMHRLLWGFLFPCLRSNPPLLSQGEQLAAMLFNTQTVFVPVVGPLLPGILPLDSNILSAGLFMAMHIFSCRVSKVHVNS